MENMKTLIKKTALDLIQKNQTTTTLEVKNELIHNEPIYYWKQDFISVTLGQLAQAGELDFTDNGVFRTYTLPNSSYVAQPSIFSTPASAKLYKKLPLTQRGIKKVNLTDLADIVKENAGKFITVVHTKRTDGSLNVMNCQVLKDRTNLGAFRVKEQGQTKSFYPTDLKEVRVKGVIYKLK